ncbi:MAG: GIY-YIG nuclease family protein [Candidatus Omnitrophica bacterium]|nr:GIY-YIG nuclease family protein [Candidatus Omnitrophota bacterium]
MTPRKKVQQKRRKIQRCSQFFVYMLECSDGSFYTGYTNDLDKRVALHNKGGGSKYVRARLPARLVFSKPYKYFKLAILQERRIKTFTRQQKEALILGCSSGRPQPRKTQKFTTTD